MGQVKGRKVGLLGGTFDPVHEGHLAIAELACREIGLQELLFLPAPDPPHKKQPGAPFHHRAAMLELALAGRDDWSLSLLEAELGCPSYTVDTLLELKKRLGDQRFFFIMGADSLLELHLWYRYQDLLELTDLVVAARPGISPEQVERAVAQLPGDFSPLAGPKGWRRSDGCTLFYLARAAAAVSSSMVREQLRNGRQPAAVPPPVLDYIKSHHLYQPPVIREKL